MQVNGLVDQLQSDALDQGSSVSALLRKVKVAAVKLALGDALEWVQRELDGYKDKDDLPDYRTTRGNPVGWNPYHGWQPMLFADERISDMITQVSLFEPVGSFEAILKESSSGTLLKPLPAGLVAQMNNMFGWDIPKAALEFPRGSIVNVVEQVRNLVLDWSLELARAGINGEGMAFTMEERKRAAGSQIHIGQLNGSFSTGDAIGANARVNIGSNDHSINRANDCSVFRDIEMAAEAIDDRQIRAAILSANREMERASSASTFVGAYQKFIGLVADHMGVFGPMLPALTALLAGH
ncbi:MAG: hypothetical protein BGO24_05525 [Sphingomonas sp. 67-36]|nr:MAG: hypothetical protein BGO24_05525 [Sphingomonas sp. 67-36]